MITVLLTSVGTDSAVALCQGLRSYFGAEVRLIGVDLKSAVACQPFLDRFDSVPPRSDKNHLSALAELCRLENVTHVWPLSGDDQEILAAEQSHAMAGRVVVTSPLEAIRVSNDKIRLYEFCVEKGLPVPRYHVVEDRHSLELAAVALGYPEQPVVLKLAKGTGAAGLKILQADIEEEAMFVSRLNRNVTLERCLQQLAAITTWPRMMISEYLPGEEYSVDVLMYRGTWHGSVVRRRDDSIFGLATDATVVADAEIERLSRRLAEELKLEYVSNIQMRRDRQGRPQLMEINPRVPGTIGLTIGAGANLPAMALALSAGRAVTDRKPLVGTRIVRYFGGTVIHP